ncbi:MAG: single-stranded DNA-binding protein [bacterium]|nr:single-stranded DNA-binding protein [bacterium]
MASMNMVFLIGRLASDPELRYTPGGTAVADFRIAVDRFRGRDETGEKQTDFFKVVVWSKLAELCSKYLSKGRMAAVEGRLQSRSYTDRDGVKRTVTEVVGNNVQFIGGKPESKADDLADEESPF